jgi:hypothetical protein
MDEINIIFPIIICTFLLGYIVSQLRKPVVINSTMLSIINSISFLSKFFNSPSIEIELFNDKKVSLISSKDINFYVRNSIKTKYKIRVLTIVEKDESNISAGDDNICSENENIKEISIGKYLDYYFGLDISPKCLGYEKFEIQITPKTGYNNFPRTTFVEGDTTIYEHLTNNSSLLTAPFILQFNNKNNKNIHIDLNSIEQE